MFSCTMHHLCKKMSMIAIDRPSWQKTKKSQKISKRIKNEECKKRISKNIKTLTPYSFHPGWSPQLTDPRHQQQDMTSSRTACPEGEPQRLATSRCCTSDLQAQKKTKGSNLWMVQVGAYVIYEVDRFFKTYIHVLSCYLIIAIWSWWFIIARNSAWFKGLCEWLSQHVCVTHLTTKGLRVSEVKKRPFFCLSQMDKAICANTELENAKDKATSNRSCWSSMNFLTQLQR